VEFMEIIKAVILGVVQGITEWLPVSSTGHLILVEEFIKFNLSEIFRSTFMVVIQLGSIIAVLVLHFSKLCAADLARHRIRVNAVVPGFIATPIFGSGFGLDRKRSANDTLAAPIAVC